MLSLTFAIALMQIAPPAPAPLDPTLTAVNGIFKGKPIVFRLDLNYWRIVTLNDGTAVLVFVPPTTSPSGAPAPVALIATPSTRIHRIPHALLQPDGTVAFGESAYSIDRVVVNGLEVDQGFQSGGYDVIADPASNGRVIGVKPLGGSWVGMNVTVVYAIAPENVYTLK